MSRWISLLLVLLLSVVAIQAQTANARVESNWATLNLRTEPNVNAAIVVELRASTPLIVSGRSSDNRWYQAQTLEGQSGWVAAAYVELLVAQSSIPIVATPAPAPVVTSENNETPAPVVNSAGTNGRVTVAGLNLRTSPSLSGGLITQLSNGTQVLVTGRSASGLWLQVQLADGRTGWAATRYIQINVALSSIPFTEGNVVNNPSNPSSEGGTSNVTVNVPAGQAPYFTLGANAVNIWATGRSLGNRANVFSKVGDSISVEEVSYRPIGYGVYNLGEFSYLQSTINFFSGGAARTDNPFNNSSLAAGGGWTTQTVLNPNFANQSVCEVGETPLVCEYRLNKPSVALIMLGTNDTTSTPAEQFAYNMRAIANISIDMGVIPVLATIPPRLDYPGRAEAYNQLIVDVAREMGLPLWDFYSAIAGLPNSGMMEDGLHPSIPPGDFVNGANFSPQFLQYGYVMRNLTMLQALDVLRANVLQ